MVRINQVCPKPYRNLEKKNSLKIYVVALTF